MELYNLIYISKILELSTHVIREWLKFGYISAIIPPKGFGSSIKFNAENIYNIALFEELLMCGFYRKNAAKILKGIDWSKETYSCVLASKAEVTINLAKIKKGVNFYL